MLALLEKDYEELRTMVVALKDYTDTIEDLDKVIETLDDTIQDLDSVIQTQNETIEDQRKVLRKYARLLLEQGEPISEVVAKTCLPREAIEKLAAAEADKT